LKRKRHFRETLDQQAHLNHSRPREHASDKQSRNRQLAEPPCPPPIALPCSVIPSPALSSHRGLRLSWRLQWIGSTACSRVPAEPHAAFPSRAGRSLLGAGICYHPVKQLAASHEHGHRELKTNQTMQEVSS